MKNVKLTQQMITAFYPPDKNKKKEVEPRPNTYSNLKIGTKTYNSNSEYMKDVSDHFPVMIDVEIE